MDDYDFIEKKIRENMVQGQMHQCLRDIGRLAGGYRSASRISYEECDRLGQLAESMAIDKRLARTEWAKAVAYGSGQPVGDARPRQMSDRDISWDSVIDDNDFRIVDESFLETEEVVVPTDSWDPCGELSWYVSNLFKADEHVCFCTTPNERGKPGSAGVWAYTAGDIARKLKKGRLENVVGTVDERFGAWIRINPLDGNGGKDENVTSFRHALVECDEMPVEKQIAIYKKLELPCTCIVHSGGKSAHAIVKVEASSYEEYRTRVKFLFDVCEKNGLKVDQQNKNPSRYSRMPGVMRDGQKQFIVERNCGKSSWSEWETWINDVNDDLPDFTSLASVDFDNLPPKKPELIEGLLRVGDKMRIAGPSKAGKSFALIELAVAVAEGGRWFGFQCRQGAVLYVNLELNDVSVYNRFADIYRALGIPPAHKDLISVWNMRGHALPLDVLAPKLIRRAKDSGFILVIVDPIYKVLTGDENSATDMGKFSDAIDRISRECDCAYVDCHHHSKGAQGGKFAMDRQSGSGVFARDPDALVDLLPLCVDDPRRQLKNIMECDVIAKAAMEATGDPFPPFFDEGCEGNANLMWEAVQRNCTPLQVDAVREARGRFNSEDGFNDVCTGWRVSFEARDFKPKKPVNLWFYHPLHTRFHEELLQDAIPEGEEQKPWQRRTASKPVKQERKDRFASFRETVLLMPNETHTVNDMAAMIGVNARTVYRYCKDLGWSCTDGVIVPNGVKK